MIRHCPVALGLRIALDQDSYRHAALIFSHPNLRLVRGNRIPNRLGPVVINLLGIVIVEELIAEERLLIALRIPDGGSIDSGLGVAAAGEVETAKYCRLPCGTRLSSLAGATALISLVIESFSADGNSPTRLANWTCPPE